MDPNPSTLPNSQKMNRMLYTFVYYIYISIERERAWYSPHWHAHLLFFVGILCFDAFPCHCCEITVFPPAEGLKARTTLAYHSLSAAVSGRCGLLWSDLMLCRLVGYDDLGAGRPQPWTSKVTGHSHGEEIQLERPRAGETSAKLGNSSSTRGWFMQWSSRSSLCSNC